MIEYKEVDPPIATKNELFEEVLDLNNLKKIPDDEFCKMKSKPNRWKFLIEMTPFRSYTSWSASFFFLPVSNAFVKWVFFVVSAQLIDERNRLHEKTVKSLLQIKVNLDYNCHQMYSVISKKEQLMKQIV